MLTIQYFIGNDYLILQGDRKCLKMQQTEKDIAGHHICKIRGNKKIFSHTHRDDNFLWEKLPQRTTKRNGAIFLHQIYLHTCNKKIVLKPQNSLISIFFFCLFAHGRNI